MNIILVAGFWLGGSSWDPIAKTLRDAGHHVEAPTLPGLESLDTDRFGIGLADHIEAVTGLVDAIDGDVVLVGHSGGGAIIHGVVDKRHSRITRAIYVDSLPIPDGVAINISVPGDDNEIPLPAWDTFRSGSGRDLRDFTEEQLDHFRASSVPQPVAVARDPQRLGDALRHAVPVTLISTTYTAAEIHEAISQGDPHVAELPHLVDLEIVELATSHWPQFTKPRELGEHLLALV